jgi:hypothetical protein
MKSTALCLTLLLGLLAPVRADEAADLEKQVELIDKTAQESSQPDAALAAVAKKTRVSEGRLKEQQAKTKLNPGGLYIANTLAAKTGKSFDEIMAAKNNGKGWGQIAKENNVKLGPLVSEAKKLEKDQRAALKQADKAPKEKGAGKPAGKPAGPETKPKGGDNAGGGKKK